MAWSTQQLATIANTTVNTVRHYHRIGLLPQPERSGNGYKRYGIPHLVRLLRIRRLRELGIPLTQIAAMDHDDAASLDELRSLDAELSTTIERLTRVRAELAQLLAHEVPAQTPPSFAEMAQEFSPTQQSLLAVYATVFDEPTLEAFRRALSDPDPTDEEFDRLPADATDADVADLARRMAPAARRQRHDHPELVDAAKRSPHGEAAAGLILAHAVVELYNPAQLRVLQRLDQIRQDDAPADRP